MDDAEWMDWTLEQVAERVGDPAPLVFERLFAEAPDLKPLFWNDGSGAVRAEMFMRAIECLQHSAGAQQYGVSLVAAEHRTHLGYGVPTGEFQRFFTIVVDVFREVLGTDWTEAVDLAWGRALQRMAQATA